MGGKRSKPLSNRENTQSSDDDSNSNSGAGKNLNLQKFNVKNNSANHPHHHSSSIDTGKIVRRAHHNLLERKRRDHIKESFNGLRDAVLLDVSKEKASRATILQKAKDVITSLDTENNKKDFTNQDASKAKFTVLIGDLFFALSSQVLYKLREPTIITKFSTFSIANCVSLFNCKQQRSCFPVLLSIMNQYSLNKTPKQLMLSNKLMKMQNLKADKIINLILSCS